MQCVKKVSLCVCECERARVSIWQKKLISRSVCGNLTGVRVYYGFKSVWRCVCMCERAAVVCLRGGCVCGGRHWRTMCKRMFVCACFWRNNEHLCVGASASMCVCVCVYAGSLLGKHMYVPNYVSVGVVVCFAWKQQAECARICARQQFEREKAREMAWQWCFSCSNQGEYSPGPVYLSLPAVCPHASSARSGGGLCVCVYLYAQF